MTDEQIERLKQLLNEDEVIICYDDDPVLFMHGERGAERLHFVADFSMSVKDLDPKCISAYRLFLSEL